MKKSSSIVIGLVVLVVLVVGGFLVFHKSPAKSTASTGGSSSKSSTVPAVNNAVLMTMSDATLGQYLTDPSSKPLYTYGGDTSGVSNCSGTCLANWPAYIDKGATTGLPTGISTITRKDNGQVQYTYNGLPLYYFAGDSSTKPTGNGVSDFSIAKPAASTSASSSSSAPASSSSSTPSYSSSSSSSSSSNPY